MVAVSDSPPKPWRCVEYPVVRHVVHDADNGQQKDQQLWPISVTQTLQLRQDMIHASFIGSIEQICLVDMPEHSAKISIHHHLTDDERRNGDEESRIHTRIE